MIKRIFKYTTTLIIVILFFNSTIFTACSDQPSSEEELRAEVYNNFIQSLENPVNKFYEYTMQYVIKEIVTMSIKEFIPNTEIGLGIKFTDSLYGLFSLRDLRNIEKVNKKNAEALGLTIPWQELIEPFYWEGGSVSKKLENEIIKNYYDEFQYDGYKYLIGQSDYGANNLIHELKFMEHMCYKEIEERRDKEKLLEILYSERQFLEEHLKSLVTEQMANGIEEKLRHYSDSELADGERFYKKSVELLGAFILSEINYLSEKIEELESELGIETGTTTEKVDLGSGKEDEKIEPEIIEEEIEDGEEDSSIGSEQDKDIEKKYFNFEKLATQHFTAKEAASVAREYVYDQLGFERPLFLNSKGFDGIISIDKNDSISSTWTVSFLDFAGRFTWYNHIVEVHENNVTSYNVYDCSEEVNEYLEVGLNLWMDLNDYWRDSDDALLDFKEYFEKVEIRDYKDFSVNLNFLTFSDSFGYEWYWDLKLWLDDNKMNISEGYTGGNFDIEPFNILINDNMLNDDVIE